MSVHRATAAKASPDFSTANQPTAKQPAPKQSAPHPSAYNNNNSTWSAERVELLKRHFNAGLSCSQIAREIGVTRNAVIGKMNRLGLSRPRDVIAGQREHRRSARLARPKTPAGPRPRRPRLSIFAQHEMLAEAFPEPQLRVEDVPIVNGCGCTLLELSRTTCRWPVSATDRADARFCGSTPIEGLPYCPGHARIAYRPAGRRRTAL
jgi:GcrA cell cycle regulator